jgi:hypothetical protein
MRGSMKPGLAAFALSMGLPLSAAATGEAPAPAPVDWHHALWMGFVAAGLWVIAFLFGRLWISVKSARADKADANRPDE